MDEKPDQIMGHIEAQRNQLGRNLNELESRVRENADWHTWYDRNPMMILGAALGGGLIVGSVIGGKTSGIRHRSHRRDATGNTHRESSGRSGSAVAGAAAAGTAYAAGKSESHSSGSSLHAAENKIKSAVSSLKHSESWHQVSDTVEDVRAALIAFGITKAKDFLNQTIPGFEEHLNEAQQRRHGRSGQQEEHDRKSSGQHAEQASGKGEEQGRAEKEPKIDDQSGKGRHLYTPSGEQIARSGSYSSDPVGAYKP